LARANGTTTRLADQLDSLPPRTAVKAASGKTRHTPPAVASPLLKPVAIGVVGMVRPVLASVIAMTTRPSLLRLSLIGGGSRHHPAACSGASVAPLALTGRLAAITLLGNLGEPGHAAGMPGRMTRAADAQNQREAWVTPPVGDNRRDVHRNNIGRIKSEGQFR
jgi:hypothetical protein